MEELQKFLKDEQQESLDVEQVKKLIIEHEVSGDGSQQSGMLSIAGNFPCVYI